MVLQHQRTSRMACEVKVGGREALGRGAVVVPAGVLECCGQEEGLEGSDGCGVDVMVLENADESGTCEECCYTCGLALVVERRCCDDGADFSGNTPV